MEEENLPEGVTITEDKISITDNNGSTIEFADGDVVIQAGGDVELKGISVSRKDPVLNKPKKPKAVNNYDELLEAAKAILDHYLSRHREIRNPLFQRLNDVINKPANS